jgi:alkylresorcinol/alkylpyrone synthase
MSVFVRAIETAVPPTALHQSEVRDLLAAQPQLSRLGRRRIHACFDASGIDTRHSVLSDLKGRPPGEPGRDAYLDPGPALIYDAATGRILAPGTGARNDAYLRQAPALFVGAAKQALAAATGIVPDDVTHVVTVSCTGFYAPGPDYHVVRELGLRASTQRYHLGFMGCYGAFPALRMAKAACEADPAAVVLIVCAELCSLHLQVSDDPDVIVSSSVFADGAAAAVVTAGPATSPGEMSAGLEIEALSTVLTAGGETDMTWTIGDQGFDMVLTGNVPRLIEAQIEQALGELVAPIGMASEDLAAIPRWAIHPGGRSVLDRAQRALRLGDDQLRPSREVLRRYGNMSSATILFILREHLTAPAAPDRERVCAVAFGPGLTVESALLRRTPTC